MRSRVLAGLFLGSLLIAVTPGVAHAHADVERITPVSGQVLRTPPTSITIRFSEPVRVDAATLIDGDGALRASTVRTDGTLVTITPNAPLAAEGTLTATWQVTSDDGHVVNGAAAYVLGRPAKTGAAQRLAAQPSIPMTLSGSRPGRLTLTIGAKGARGEVEWTSAALPAPITWRIRPTGRTASAVGVLPLPGTWTARATIARADGSIVVARATTTVSG